MTNSDAALTLNKCESGRHGPARAQQCNVFTSEHELVMGFLRYWSMCNVQPWPWWWICDDGDGRATVMVMTVWRWKHLCSCSGDGCRVVVVGAQLWWLWFTTAISRRATTVEFGHCWWWKVCSCGTLGHMCCLWSCSYGGNSSLLLLVGMLLWSCCLISASLVYTCTCGDYCWQVRVMCWWFTTIVRLRCQYSIAATRLKDVNFS